MAGSIPIGTSEVASVIVIGELGKGGGGGAVPTITSKYCAPVKAPLVSPETIKELNVLTRVDAGYVNKSTFWPVVLLIVYVLAGLISCGPARTDTGEITPDGGGITF
jgi:hypothetical protein